MTKTSWLSWSVNSENSGQQNTCELKFSRWLHTSKQCYDILSICARFHILSQSAQFVQIFEICRWTIIFLKSAFFKGEILPLYLIAIPQIRTPVDDSSHKSLVSLVRVLTGDTHVFSTFGSLHLL